MGRYKLAQKINRRGAFWVKPNTGNPTSTSQLGQEEMKSVSPSIISTLSKPIDSSLCPWDSPSKNSGVDCHALLQGIFPTQGLNPGLPHCRQILSHPSRTRSGNWFSHSLYKGENHIPYSILVKARQCGADLVDLCIPNAPWWGQVLNKNALSKRSGPRLDTGLEIPETGLPRWYSGLRVRLPMSGTWVQSLVQEDSTCPGAAKPVHCNCWAYALEPGTHSEPACHNYWSPLCPRAHGHAPKTGARTTRSPNTTTKRCPCSLQLENAGGQQCRPSETKNKNR